MKTKLRSLISGVARAVLRIRVREGCIKSLIFPVLFIFIHEIRNSNLKNELHDE